AGPVGHGGEPLEVLAGARVGDDAGALDLRAVVREQPRERAQHLRGQVVDHEAARVLEHVHGRRLAGPGEAGHDAEIVQPRAHRPVLLRWAYRSRATLGGTPGTASSCSRLAPSTASGGPKCFSNARLRAGPTPGRASMTDSVIALSRRIRWWVMAKRWASSRTRWSSCSSGVSWGSRS